MQIGLHLLTTHPLDKDLSTQLQHKPPLCQDPPSRLRHLDASAYACAVHAAGQVHRRPPDVILRFGGTDHPSDHRPVGNTCSEGTKSVKNTKYSGR